MNIISKNTFKDAFFNEFHEEDFWKELLKKAPLLQVTEKEQSGSRYSGIKNLIPFYLNELNDADYPSDYFCFLLAIGEDLVAAQETLKNRFHEMAKRNICLDSWPIMHLYLLKLLSRDEDFPQDFLKTNLPTMPEVLVRCVIPQEIIQNLKVGISSFSVFVSFNLLFTLYENKSSSKPLWIKEEAIKLEKKFHEYVESKKPLTVKAIAQEIDDEFRRSLDDVRQIIKEMQI